MKVFLSSLALLLVSLAGCGREPAADHASAMAATDETAASDPAVPSGMSASDAWIREVPAGGSVAGGYLTIVNGTDADDRLLAVGTDRAARVEIHEMRHENGMTRMRHLADGLPLPAGAATALEPGGYHLMFIEPVQPFTPGDVVPATLRFANAPDVEVAFAVRPLAAAAEDEHAGH